MSAHKQTPVDSGYVALLMSDVLTGMAAPTNSGPVVVATSRLILENG